MNATTWYLALHSGISFGTPLLQALFNVNLKIAGRSINTNDFKIENFT